jgi:hypothetical protein
MTTLNVQPDSNRLTEDRYDTLEVMQIEDHFVLIQVSEDGEAETLVIGPQQAKALAALLTTGGR